MLWILLMILFPKHVLTRSQCGGLHTSKRGVLQTPGFPEKFPVPINCEWVIEAHHTTPESTIVVYLTQLYVLEGLSFTEYQVYDKTYQLNGKEICRVNENNIIGVNYIETYQEYLVINLKLENSDSTHIRVLDHILDVYGFNITYEITTSGRKEDSCTMATCGFTGICYDHHT